MNTIQNQILTTSMFEEYNKEEVDESKDEGECEDEYFSKNESVAEDKIGNDESDFKK